MTESNLVKALRNTQFRGRHAKDVMEYVEKNYDKFYHTENVKKCYFVMLMGYLISEDKEAYVSHSRPQDKLDAMCTWSVFYDWCDFGRLHTEVSNQQRTFEEEF